MLTTTPWAHANHYTMGPCNHYTMGPCNHYTMGPC